MLKNKESKIEIDGYRNNDERRAYNIKLSINHPITFDQNIKAEMADIFDIHVSSVDENFVEYIADVANCLWSGDIPDVRVIINQFRTMKNVNELIGFYCIAERNGIMNITEKIKEIFLDMQYVIDLMAKYFAIDYMINFDDDTISRKYINNSAYYMYYRCNKYSNIANTNDIQYPSFSKLNPDVMKQVHKLENYRNYVTSMQNRRFNPFNTGFIFFSALEEVLYRFQHSGRFRFLNFTNRDWLLNMLRTIRCVNDNQTCIDIPASLRNNCFNCYRYYSLGLEDNKAYFSRDRINQQLTDWSNGAPITNLWDFMRDVFKGGDFDYRLVISFINNRRDEFIKVYPDFRSVRDFIESNVIRDIFKKYYNEEED